VDERTHVVSNDLTRLLATTRVEFNAMKGKRLLLTGGAGFLGYYIVQSILHWNEQQKREQDKIKLVVYDNFIRGVPPWFSSFAADEWFRLEKRDVTQPLAKDVGDFNYVIHAASIASPSYYRLHPIGTMDANVNGLRILLDYCVEQQERGRPVDGMLFFSSSEIYGDPSPENIPTSEGYLGYVSCTGPRACYDESKRYGETLCVNFARQYNLPIKVARPFNNYGPGLKITDRRVIPDFARDILSGNDIVMLSDGRASRTFCYITDAIAGYFKILVQGKRGEAYNIGVESPEISIGHLADLMVETAQEYFRYKGKVVRKKSDDSEYLVDNPQRRCPIIQKARADLGYDPKVSVSEGIRRSLLWYAENNHSGEE